MSLPTVASIPANEFILYEHNIPRGFRGLRKVEGDNTGMNVVDAFGLRPIDHGSWMHGRNNGTQNGSLNKNNSQTSQNPPVVVLWRETSAMAALKSV